MQSPLASRARRPSWSAHRGPRTGRLRLGFSVSGGSEKPPASRARRPRRTTQFQNPGGAQSPSAPRDRRPRRTASCAPGERNAPAVTRARRPQRAISVPSMGTIGTSRSRDIADHVSSARAQRHFRAVRPEIRRAAGRARGRGGGGAVRGTARRHRLRALGGRTTHPCPRARRPPIPYRYAHDRASGGRPEAPQGDQGVCDWRTIRGSDEFMQ